MMNDKALTLRGKKAVWAPGGGTGPIDPKRLPEGYPYKEKGATILDVTHEFPMLRQQQFPAENGGLEEGKVYTVTITDPNGNVTKKVETADNASGGIGFQVVYNEYSYALTIRYRAEGNVYNIIDSGDGGQFTITIEAPETIHPMAPEFLPAGVGGGGLLFEVADDELEAGSSSAQQIVTKNYDPLYEALMKGQSVVIKMSLGGEPALIVPSVYMVQSGTGLFAAIPDATITFTNGSYH